MIQAADAPMRRVLGPWAAASVVIGMVVGAGIFRSASAVAANLGSAEFVLLAWLAGGAIALAGAFCYAELCSAYPDPGGDYRFLKEAFGGELAFLFAWSRFAIIFTASGAMLAFVAADYLAQLLPMGPLGRGVFAAGAILILTALNLRGIRTGSRGEVVLVAIDVIALAALAAAGLWLAGHATPPLDTSPVPPPHGSLIVAFGAALVFVMLAYGGFNDSATLSREVRSPRDMTRALVGGMAVVAALYTAANWAYLRGLGVAGLAASRAPAADLAARAFGPAGEAAIVIAVGAAALAVLNALVIVGGRTLYATAASEPALSGLAKWDSKRGVPRRAVWAQCAVSIAMVALGTWTTKGFQTMVDLMAPVYWLFLTLSSVALFKLRRMHPDIDRPYRVPLYPLPPLLFGGASALMLVSAIAYVGLAGCALSFGLLLLGIVTRRLMTALAQ